MKTSKTKNIAVKISKPADIRRVGRLTPLRRVGRLTPLRKVGRLTRKENGSKGTN